MGESEDLFEEFEAVGEDKVRANFMTGRYGGPRRALAPLWLATKERLRSEASAESAIAEAREANRIARAANTIAIPALIAAITSALMAISAIVLSIIALLHAS